MACSKYQYCTIIGCVGPYDRTSEFTTGDTSISYLDLGEVNEVNMFLNHVYMFAGIHFLVSIESAACLLFILWRIMDTLPSAWYCYSHYHGLLIWL